jgi:RimJ/RimL family protein N-acetyltransferase
MFDSSISHDLKCQTTAGTSAIPVYQYGRPYGWLVPVTGKDGDCAESLKQLTAWRQVPGGGLDSTFPMTDEGTRLLLREDMFGNPGRKLFWVKGKGGEAVGLIGLTATEPPGGRAEVTVNVRGTAKSYPGLMYAATQTLAAWAFQTRGVSDITARVAADNQRALRLYQRCGFRMEGGQTAALATAATGQLSVELCLNRRDWMAGHHRDRAA